MLHSRSILLLPLAAGLAGCVPFPHTITLSPTLSGVVETAGRPAKDVEVFLAAGPPDRPCDSLLRAVRTDEAGKFSVPRRSQFRILYAPLVAPLAVTEFTVCLSSARGPVVGYRGVTSQSSDRALVLHCDPERPPQPAPIRRVGSDARGICEPLRPPAPPQPAASVAVGR